MTSSEAKKKVRTVKEIVHDIYHGNADSAVKTNSAEKGTALVKDILYGKGQESVGTKNSAVMMTTPSAQKSVPFVKDILSGKIQLASKTAKQTTRQITTSQMASTLTTALSSPEAKSVIVQLPNGSVVLVTPSDSNTTTTTTAKQATQKESVNQKMKDPTSLQSQTVNQFGTYTEMPRRINVVKVHRFPPGNSGTTQKTVAPTARTAQARSARDDMNSKSKEGNVPLNPGKKCTRRSSSSVGTQHDAICSVENVSPPKKRSFSSDRESDPTTLSQEDLWDESTRNRETFPDIHDDPVPSNLLQKRNPAKDGIAVKDVSPSVKGCEDGQSKSEQTNETLGSALNDGPGIENVCDAPQNTDIEISKKDGIVKAVMETKENKGSISCTNKARRTVRPKRNLSASYVKLTKMRLGRKTSVQLKGCLIPAIRMVCQTPPKLTSTNVFNKPGYMPSALDLKRERETKIEEENPKRHELEAEPAKTPENVDVDSVSSNTDRTKSNTGTCNKSPMQQINIKSTEEQSNDSSDDLRGNSSKFFLVKTSTGSYLVPMKRDEMGAVDLAKEAQESLEKYLTDSPGSNHEQEVSPKISKQNSSPKGKGNSPEKQKQNTEDKGAKFETDEKSGDFDRKNPQEDDQSQRAALKSVTLERSASERDCEFAPPAKVAKLADEAKNQNKAKTTSDRIKALKEKLKKKQEELEAIRQKKFLKTSLDEYDDL